MLWATEEYLSYAEIRKAFCRCPAYSSVTLSGVVWTVQGRILVLSNSDKTYSLKEVILR